MSYSLKKETLVPFNPPPTVCLCVAATQLFYKNPHIIAKKQVGQNVTAAKKTLN
jgi:hypothetical protein